MNENEQVYLDLLKRILTEGVNRPDRTGTGVISLFGHQIEFDVSDSYPLLTTKKMNIKSIMSELLWFIEGSSDERRLAEIRYGKNRNTISDKSTIWTANAKADYWKSQSYYEGDLGKVYGQNWRRWLSSSKITKEIPKKPDILCEPFVPNNIKLNKEIIKTDDSEVVRETASGKCKILGNSVDGKTVIEFISSGVQIETPDNNFLELTDPYEKTVNSVACYGRITETEKSYSYYDRAMVMWKNIIKICYDQTSKDYVSFGGAKRKVVVSPQWKCFANFLRDLPEIPYFYNWVKDHNYDLDKEYYGSNGYSKETCIFLLPKEIQAIDNKPMVQTTTGELFQSTRSALWQYGLNMSLEPYAPKANNIVREIKVIDQLQEVIDGINNDPYGRRHILSAWNVADLDNMALPPCHIMVQFYVCNDKLSCKMYQRSADFFLGSPYNIASYVALLKMIAQVCGLSADKFIYTMGDAHIYENHIDAAKEQLGRTPLKPSYLRLDPLCKNIDSFHMNSYELLCYEHHPSIKGNMAV